jgi:hypothetical protein
VPVFISACSEIVDLDTELEDGIFDIRNTRRQRCR